MHLAARETRELTRKETVLVWIHVADFRRKNVRFLNTSIRIILVDREGTREMEIDAVGKAAA
jgi:hypothetical protein